MHLNDLNTDCLLLIFKQLPISHLLRLQTVCTKWTALQLDVCFRKQRLTLMGKEQFNVQKDHLLIEELDDSTRLKLCELFPNVKHLVFQNKQLFASNLSLLLKALQEQLVSLNVQIYETSDPGTKTIQKTTQSDWNLLFALFETHNFPSLRILDIRDTSTGTAKATFTCKLPRLPLLNELYFGFNLADPVSTSTYVNQNMKYLKKLAIWEHYNWSNKRIKVDNDRYEFNIKYEPLFQLVPPVSYQITFLNLTFFIEWTEFTSKGSFISDIFPNLKELILNTILPIELLLTRFHLASLKQLKYLQVICNHHCNYIHKPIETLPLAPANVDAIQFSSLETFVISKHFPETSFSLKQLMFPSLKFVKIEKLSSCDDEKCNEHLNQFIKNFKDSFKKWNNAQFRCTDN